MSTRFSISGLILAVFALPAAAEEVEGKWDASIESPQGTFAMAFEFMVEGDVLKGTMSNEFMGELPISDGKIDGNEISFKVAMDGGPGGPMTLTYAGALDDDKIILTTGFEGAGGPGGAPDGMPPLTLTRAESE